MTPPDLSGWIRTVIRRYNRNQILKAFLALVGGAFCCLLAYLFFRYLPGWVGGFYGWKIQPLTTILITIAGLAAVAFSGYRAWADKGGLKGYHESALYHDLGEDTGGAVMVDYYLHRITGPAHVLSQIFIAGPLLLLNSRTFLASLISHSTELESKLDTTLKILQAANKWQPITDYPHQTSEILYLARMGLIDFSAIKEVPRIKARLPDGD